MILLLCKVNTYVFKELGISSPRQAALNPLWLGIDSVINLCNTIMEDYKGLSRKCVDWIRSEGIRVREVRKTDPAKARLIQGLIRANEINVVYLEDHFCDFMIQKLVKDKNELIQRNKDIYDLRIKFAKLHGKSKTTTGDVYTIDEERFISDHKESEHHIKAAITENVVNIKETKLAYVREMESMTRQMSMRRTAIAKATGLIKAIDEYNRTSVEVVDRLKSLMDLQRRRVQGHANQKMFAKVGLAGWRFFDGGSNLIPNLYECWRKGLITTAWGHNALWDRIKTPAGNFYNLLHSKVRVQAIEIGTDTRLFTRKLKIAQDREEAFINNFAKMKDDMAEDRNCSEYAGFDQDEFSELSDIDEKLEFETADDKEDLGYAKVYREKAFRLFQEQLDGIKKIWEENDRPST
jgi:hypothetical protein